MKQTEVETSFELKQNKETVVMKFAHIVIITYCWSSLLIDEMNFELCFRNDTGQMTR